jgi:hypothetical protein
MPFDVRDRGDLTRSRKHWRAIYLRLHKRANRAKAMIAKRDRQLKALPASSQAKKAAQFYLDHAGWHEDGGRPNRAAWLDAWARDIGAWMIGQPWCGLAVYEACKAAGLILDKTTVSTVAIRSMAQRGVGGFKRWHPPSATPKIGWVAVYGTAASGPVHTGMYLGDDRMGEGNTSPGNGGSQANGGGLYIRSLAQRRSWLLGWAEPAFTS